VPLRQRERRQHEREQRGTGAREGRRGRQHARQARAAVLLLVAAQLLERGRGPVLLDHQPVHAGLFQLQVRDRLAGEHQRALAASSRLPRAEDLDQLRYWITPQPMRPPALPVGCVTRSSTDACTMTARPRTEFAPSVTVRSGISSTWWPSPCSSTQRLPRSPAWCSGACGEPWFFVAGLK